MVIFDGSALHSGAVGLVCGLARGLGLPLLYDDEGCADLSPLAAQARPPSPFPLLSAKRKPSLAI